VCVCVFVCLCVSERVRERESVCVFVCEDERERARDIKREKEENTRGVHFYLQPPPSSSPIELTEYGCVVVRVDVCGCV